MADATADPLHAHSDDSGSENGHRTTEASTKAVTPEPTAAPAPSPAAADNTASSAAPPPTATPRESSVVRHEAKEYGIDNDDGRRSRSNSRDSRDSRDSRRRGRRGSHDSRDGRGRGGGGGGNGGAPSDARSQNRVFVGGLAEGVTTEVLRSHFEQYGAVQDAEVLVDRATGRSRGFGFVSFREREAFDKCLGEQQHKVQGGAVHVRKAVSKDEARDAYVCVWSLCCPVMPCGTLLFPF